MIYTFYSYKGGVGRSMALANIAECFYLEGLRVLIVDWDLEAPGLESFFFRSPDADSVTSPGVENIQGRLGLLDMLTEYKRAFADFAGKEGGDFSARLSAALSPRSFIYPIHGQLGSGSSTTPHLSLLPAGWRGSDRFASYAHAVQGFNWQEFYSLHRGREYFDWLATEWAKIADVVFIDSRTGVTEMGGVCARQLADVVVSLCAPNFQNVEGVAKMVDSFQRDDPSLARERNGRALKSVVVPTRIEPKDLDRLRRFLLRFEKLVDETKRRPAELQNRPFWDLRIPFVSAYAYEENLVIGPPGFVEKLDPTATLETAYWKLATTLARLAPDDHIIRFKFADRVKREFGSTVPETVMTYMPDGAGVARVVRDRLVSSGVSLWPDIDHDSHSALATIDRSKALIVIVTPGIAESTAIGNEVRHARRGGATVYAVSDASDNAAPLPPWLARATRIESPRDIDALVRSIEHPTGVRAPNMAPPIPENFVPRKEELEVRTALLNAAQSAGVSTVAVCGRGGLGKTSLATRVCHDADIEDAFPAGILWMAAGAPNQLTSLQAIYTALTGETPLFKDEPDARQQVKKCLTTGGFLLVIDDVRSQEDIDRVTLTSASYTRLILTRDASAVPADAGAIVRLDRLSDDQARQALGVDDSPHVRELIERLGGWPLALALARSHIRQASESDVGSSIETLLRDLNRHGATALDLGAPAGARLGMVIDGALREAGEEAADTLVRIARGEPVTVADAHAKRLSDLGLISKEKQGFTLHPLVRQYLEQSGYFTSDNTAERRTVSRSENSQTNVDVSQARTMLGDRRITDSAKDLKERIKRLKAARYFGYARQLCALARLDPGITAALSPWIVQQHALCTYKDVDLPVDTRLDRALAILDAADPINKTLQQETLGIAGAINKALWVETAQRQYLERALALYLRGYAQGIENDDGYTAINAAYLLDVLACQEQAADVAGDESPATLSIGRERRALAQKIRAEVVDVLQRQFNLPTPPSRTREWWFLATLAEACFGLGVNESGEVDERWYEQARYWIREGLAVDAADWEFESTARQLAQLAQLPRRSKAAINPSATRTLRVLLPDAGAVESLGTGKVGLALSGGGFRAAIFHIGVLARLAELDMLRRVEVLSCVSGGSIIGAHYYLRVRALLTRKADHEIKAQDYIDIVKDVEKSFLDGVKKNLRCRLYADPLVSWRAMFDRGFTHTNRLAALFEHEIFADETVGKPPYLLDKLTIHPKDAREDFAPKLDNWRRRAKVPILILNATTLNTGHNWQFTATWMGEPPLTITSEIDANDQFGRMYYWQAPTKYQQMSLGIAVAASAAVPGLFDPVSFDGLYKGRDVRLADGGVHDNQGVAGLLEQDCTVVLVSDGSGQMFTDAAPSAGHLAVPLRSNSILQARVRGVEFRELAARRRGGLLRGLMFVHLTKALQGDNVPWNSERREPPEPPDGPATSLGGEPRSPADYQISPDVQRLLAKVRTDLDAFSDIEAYALMLSGYRMTERAFGRAVPDFPSAPAVQAWKFLDVRPLVEPVSSPEQDYSRARLRTRAVLSAASGLFGKVWRLSPTMRFASWMWVLAAIATGIYGFVTANEVFATILNAVAVWSPRVAAGGLLLTALVWGTSKLIGARKAPSQLALSLLLGTVGWIGFLLYLALLNRLYLRKGRLPAPS